MSLFEWIILIVLAVILYRDKQRQGYLEQFVEIIMSDIDTLNETLQAIATRVGNVAVDVQTLKDQLEEMHQGGEVDLTESINLADSILSRLTALDESVENPTPPVDPNADAGDTEEATGEDSPVEHGENTD